MTDLVVATLSEAEARSLTDEVKHDSERLWRKLVELYDGDAHIVLGYSSWGAYFAAEFKQSGRRGYQLLEAGRALEVVNHGSSGQTPNERQARELAPLLDQPETMREAWNEASENGTPTALAVREAVTRRVGIPLDPDIVEKHQRDTAVEQIDRCVFVLEANTSDIQGLVDWVLETRDLNGRFGALTPSRFEKASAYCAAFAADLRRRGIDG